MQVKMVGYNYVTCSLCHSSASRFLYKFNYHKFGHTAPFVLVKCASCGHVYNNPRLKTEFLNQLYNKDYYIINQEYLEKRVWLPALEDYLNKIRPWEEKITERKLLDVGCGMGFLMKICRDNGWQVWGVDISATAIEYARSNFELDVRLGRIDDVDFGDRKFNLILALDLLEHLEQPVEFVKRCYDLLDKNGILVIETPNIGSIYKKITGRFWIGFNPYHIQLFSKDTLTKLVLMSNFKILDIHTTFNDILARRNLHRWVSNQVFLKTTFTKLSQFKKLVLASNVFLDIAKLNTVYSNLEKAMNLKKLIETRNNIIAKKFLGDQLTVFLIKR